MVILILPIATTYPAVIVHISLILLQAYAVCAICIDPISPSTLLPSIAATNGPPAGCSEMVHHLRCVRCCSTRAFSRGDAAVW
jgi:hypothetical protein